jgi:hypothetical protein
VALPAAGSRRKPPPLKGGSAATRAWWKTAWSSPMAALWLEADVPALQRLARLLGVLERGEPSALLLAEIRQLEDRFGLSPLARRRLLWEVEPPSSAALPSVESKDDGRWLRAVSD